MLGVMRWAVLAFVLLAGFAGLAEAQPSSLTHDGRARTYQVEAPEGLDRSRLWPLVVVLHGAGGSGARAMRSYRWSERAASDGFFVVGPDALPPRPDQPARFRDNPPYWNDLSGRGARAHHAIDDVGFIAAVIAAMRAAYPIDPARIYVTGFSSGASMTHLVGMRLAPLLAAVAPVAGRAWVAEKPSQPIPILMIFGEEDPLQPFAGGRGKTPWGEGPAVPPARDNATQWARLQGCAGAPHVNQPAPQVQRQQWNGCEGSAEVVFIAVSGLGHHWSRGRADFLPEATSGPNSDALDTTATIWRFFQPHRRPG
jgi:polyhydroxybutyrate depolymerase